MGYVLPPGVSRERHDHWLRKVHFPDMIKVPGLERVILNRSEKAVFGKSPPEYVAELHYPDLDAYLAAREWIKQNPFPPESRPEGRIRIKFMIVCESEELGRPEAENP